jgi:hypothetical protein
MKSTRTLGRPSAFLFRGALPLVCTAAIALIGAEPQAARGETLQVLFDGGSIETGGLWKTTNFFTTDPAGPTWVPLFDLAQTSVIGSMDTVIELLMTFDAGGQFVSTGPISNQLNFSYQVSALREGYFITGHKLDLTDSTLEGEGSVVVSVELLASNGDVLSRLTERDESIVAADLVSGSFAPQSDFTVNVHIEVNSLAEGDMASLNMFTHHFSVVPEPSTFAIVICGLLCCGLARRRLLRSSDQPVRRS